MYRDGRIAIIGYNHADISEYSRLDALYKSDWIYILDHQRRIFERFDFIYQRAEEPEKLKFERGWLTIEPIWKPPIHSLIVRWALDSEILNPEQASFLNLSCHE